MLNRFLVPLDGFEVAEQILPLTSLLATRLGEAVELVRVVPDVPLDGAGTDEEAIAEFLRTSQHEAEHYLEGIRALLESQGVRVSGVTVRVAPVAQTILDVAKEQDSGLILIATHGRVGPERWFVGSVADRVLRNATVPVLAFRPKDEAAAAPVAIEAVLVPLDGSDEATAALPYAEYLAAKLNATITLVRTVNLMALGMQGRSVPPHLLDILQDEAEQYLQRTAQAVQGRGSNADGRFSFLHPADEIASLIREHPQSLVVMTSHGRSGIARTLFGSVADRIIRTAECPVLVIGAPGVEGASPA
jgi:nucleotide-binding universal stress UspA family protein